MRWRFLLLVFGVTLIVLACNEVRLWLLADAQAHRLTCAELGAHGPGRNAHVEVTDGLLCEDAFVFEQRDGCWATTWVPLVPVDSGYGRQLTAARVRGETTRLPPPGEIAVLVRMNAAHSFADVQAVARRPSLFGVVVNAIEPLGPYERELLHKQYPAVDFATCWVLDLDRAPASVPAIAGGLGTGALVLVFLVHTLFGGRTPARAVRLGGG
jgi:hypothetical protein